MLGQQPRGGRNWVHRNRTSLGGSRTQACLFVTNAIPRKGNVSAFKTFRLLPSSSIARKKYTPWRKHSHWIWFGVSYYPTPNVSKPVQKTLRPLSTYRATPIPPGTLGPTPAIKAIIPLFYSQFIIFKNTNLNIKTAAEFC